MNKNKPFVLILLASCLAVASCKKEQSREESKTTPVTERAAARTADTYFEPNRHELSEIVVGVDETDTKLRHIRLHLSVGLMEAVKDPEIAQWIFEKVRDAEDQEIKFLDLFEAFPETKQLIEQAADPLGKFTGRSFEELEKELDYEGYQYWASIFLTNVATADGVYEPVVTPGLDIEDTEEISDIAFAWYRADDGGAEGVRVWEELATSIPVPVIAVSMMTKNEYPVSTEEPEIVKRDGVDYINDKAEITNVRIYHQYDVSKSSEYCITGYYAQLGAGQIGKYLRYSCLSGLIGGGFNDDNHYTKLLDIHKKKLGSDINPNRVFCQLRTTGELNSSRAVYFNTYERDWFAGVKYLGSVNFSAPLIMKGRMSAAHEWYQFDPNQPYFSSACWVNVWGIWSAGLGNSVTYNANYGKGHIKFTRLHPCN